MIQRVLLHTEASLGLGGQELRILTEARWLTERGWRVVMACQPTGGLLREARTAGLPAVAVPMPGTLSLPALLALRRLMLRHSVSLVHTHSSVDSWLASVAAKSLHLPLVRSRHVSIPIRRRRALVYHLADRILTSGEHVKALVQAAGIPSVKIVSIPPGIDPTRFNDGVDGNAVRRELGLSGPLVGLVANIRGSKGHRYFLEAATRVLSKVPQTHFLIVGDGVGFDDVRRRIHAMGLEPHVLMTGFRRDVAEVMAALDVLVLPSIRSEATSQVIPQALAVGTPVVATTVGGSPEIIRDGETGRLVVPGDADALAEGILDLLLDPERARAMAVAGQSLVCERFTIDATMTATTGVYDELLARRRPPRR